MFMETPEVTPTPNQPEPATEVDPDLVALKALEEQMAELERDIERIDRSPSP
ncbi:hypothetical protein LBMAG14_09640 [Actinomycetes bacterium]|nr:hypothetical protein LBMAG14_09640 [Actinomycetes bacterium]